MREDKMDRHLYTLAMIVSPSNGCHWYCAFFSADLLVWGEFLFWMGQTENALMWHFSIVSSFSDLVWMQTC